MIDEELEKIIDERKKLGPDDDLRTEEYWDKESKIMLRDMDKTIQFIQHDCSDDLFYWLSEVFDDVARQSQDRHFIEVICERNKKVKDPEQQKQILIDIDFAARALKES